MTTRYTERYLDIDQNRWYFTKFCVARYRQDVDWERVKAKFDRTAEAVESLLEGFLSAGVFGDDELTALKSTVELSSTIGPESTRERILQTGGSKEQLEHAVELVMHPDETGIVTGIPYKSSVGNAQNQLLDLFGTLLDTDANEKEYDTAVEELLALDLGNVGPGTITAIACLLHPTRYPILNTQTKEAFKNCFDIDLDESTYISDIEYFDAVREDFEFEEYFRHLDYYCYWIREETDIEDQFINNRIQDRDVWQIDVGVSDMNQPARLWPIWQELGVCSIGWDVGPLDELSEDELITAGEPYESGSVADYFRRFRDEIEPGQIIIAKEGPELLGIGVVEQGGYHYCGDLIDERIKGEAVGHPHVQPVSWRVTSEDSDWKTNEWDVSKGLSPQSTLVQTEAFEELRNELAKQNTEQIAALATLENIAADPPIATLPDVCQSSLPEEHYFILQTGSDEWEDEPASQYHFKMSIPGSRRLWDAGTAQVAYLEDGSIYATARITDIRKEERDGAEHLFAAVDEYSEIDPVDVTEAQADFETSISLQHPIIQISEVDYETILDKATTQRYFWITASPAIWDPSSIADGGEVFYTAFNEKGNKRQIFTAFEKARPGDRILFYQSSPVRKVVAEGTVTKSLHEEQPDEWDQPVKGISIRYDEAIDPIDWQTLTSVPELEGTKPISNQAQGSLFELSQSEFELILSLSSGDEPEPHHLQEQVERLRNRLSPPRISIDLPEQLYFEAEDEIKRQIESSLNSGKHIIFTGPPGTGKTKLAKHVCEHCAKEYDDVIDDYQFTTATAEWTTFDTIGGYVPNRTAEGDELVFKPRLFLNCFRREGTIRNNWLVIDEINRADIDKAFGQLFSVLSGDTVTLPYERDAPLEITSIDDDVDDDRLKSVITNQDIFPVTPSWRLLGTMNTYDKTSLYELSYAFMRRFNYIHVGVPSLSDGDVVRTSLLNPEGGENYATKWINSDESLREPLEKTFKQLATVWSKVNKHQTIGPSIVRDMLGYLAASGDEALDNPGPALTDTVIALVFPQLEGMTPNQQWGLIDSLTDNGVETEDGEVDLTLEQERLERKAKDFFNLPPRTDD